MRARFLRFLPAVPGLAAFRPLFLGLTALLGIFLVSLMVFPEPPPARPPSRNGSPPLSAREEPLETVGLRENRERSELAPGPAVKPPAPAPAEIQARQVESAWSSPADPYNVLRGGKTVPWISLTFDGDSDASDVNPILSVLGAKGVEATFFLTGDFIGHFPEETRAIVRAGHEVGNHLFRHRHLTTWEQNHRQQTLPELRRPNFQSLLRRNEELFRQITNTEMARLWRAPYGETNREINEWARESGYVHISWTRDFSGSPSMDTLDWVASPESPRYLTVSQILERVLQFDGGVPGGAGGAIILMHTGNSGREEHPWTILGEMIDGMRLKKYHFTPVTRLMRESARVDPRYSVMAEPVSP